jgi:hypothetical protein
MRVWTGTNNSRYVDFIRMNRYPIKMSPNTHTPKNITMVCSLPHLRHGFNESHQSGACTVIRRCWPRALRLGFVKFDKVTVYLILFNGYLCYWQITCPPSKMAAETESIVNDMRPQYINRLLTHHINYPVQIYSILTITCLLSTLVSCVKDWNQQWLKMQANR